MNQTVFLSLMFNHKIVFFHFKNAFCQQDEFPQNDFIFRHDLNLHFLTAVTAHFSTKCHNGGKFRNLAVPCRIQPFS